MGRPRVSRLRLVAGRVKTNLGAGGSVASLRELSNPDDYNVRIRCVLMRIGELISRTESIQGERER